MNRPPAYYISNALKVLYERDNERYWTASDIETYLKDICVRNQSLTSRQIGQLIVKGSCDKYASIETIPRISPDYIRKYRYMGDVSE